MKIGCPKEIKVHEYRVGLVPAGVRELVFDLHYKDYAIRMCHDGADVICGNGTSQLSHAKTKP